MKALAVALLMTLAAVSNAKVIHYTYDGFIVSNDLTIDTTVNGKLTVDTDLIAITHFTSKSDIGNFNWTGAASFGAPTTDPYWTHIWSGLGDGDFVVTIHLSFLNSEWDAGRFLEQLEQTQTGEFAWEIGTPETGGLTFQPFFKKIGPAKSVPEPTTIALLGLGLAALAFRRQKT